MKKAIYDDFNQIPEVDRAENNYKQVTESGSPNYGKWVLILDENHPVSKKNAELLGEKQTRETTHQQTILGKDTEIANLQNQLTQAKTQTSGLQPGQVAVGGEDYQLLQSVKSLGDFNTIKERFDEHPVLKQKDVEREQSDRYAQIAKDLGMDEKAFAKLARQEKLFERIEVRPIKGDDEKTVNHYFVKPAAGQTGDAVSLTDFVKQDENFAPFVSSLFPAEPQKEDDSVIIPPQKKGEESKAVDPADAYISSQYKRPKSEQ